MNTASTDVLPCLGPLCLPCAIHKRKFNVTGLSIQSSARSNLCWNCMSSSHFARHSFLRNRAGPTRFIMSSTSTQSTVCDFRSLWTEQCYLCSSLLFLWLLSNWAMWKLQLKAFRASGRDKENSLKKTWKAQLIHGEALCRASSKLLRSAQKSPTPTTGPPAAPSFSIYNAGKRRQETPR